MERMNQTEMVEITQSNYQYFKELDIIAFSCAECGAMGEHGGIIMVDTQGRVYHTNMLEVSEEVLFSVCPPLKDCCWGFFGHCEKLPKGWMHQYLGCGNHLLVKEGDVDKLRERTKGIQKRGELYQKWLTIVLTMIKERNV